MTEAKALCGIIRALVLVPRLLCSSGSTQSDCINHDVRLIVFKFVSWISWIVRRRLEAAAITHGSRCGGCSTNRKARPLTQRDRVICFEHFTAEALMKKRNAICSFSSSLSSHHGHTTALRHYLGQCCATYVRRPSGSTLCALASTIVRHVITFVSLLCGVEFRSVGSTTAIISSKRL